MTRTRITVDDRIRFTEGDCHILAYQIHKLTGWPICAFGAERGRGGDLHCFVRHPSGRYLDVDGLKSAKDFKAHWGAKRMTAGKTSWEWLENNWGIEAQFPGSYGRARRVARKLVEDFKT